MQVGWMNSPLGGLMHVMQGIEVGLAYLFCVQCCESHRALPDIACIHRLTWPVPLPWLFSYDDLQKIPWHHDQAIYWTLKMPQACMACHGLARSNDLTMSCTGILCLTTVIASPMFGIIPVSRGLKTHAHKQMSLAAMHLLPAWDMQWTSQLSMNPHAIKPCTGHLIGHGPNGYLESSSSLHDPTIPSKRQSVCERTFF